ncbi:MAG: efflux RND transporter permease subunit [Hyphomonas oceanitis]|uniref:Acriflavin resistance protein n=1 Tax=Hyphomonas oceanitis SCH89 TaxID=1280953 RepID=A0A059G549_9PROT|nr:efflux RND transporter permease subunit [Hyphomonas oceanitis]KDA01957.1 acriflavin resistance protein [Hyphomonas oceanitis SCH89]
MSGFIRWWADNKVAANLLMIALIIAGIVAYLRMERELEPYVEFPGAAITVVWRGASPQDVEEQLTVRMEEAVSTVEGIKELSSSSYEGVARVVVVGNEDLDEGKFLQELKRQIDSISTFPSAAEPAQIHVFRNRYELMRIAVSADESVSEQELKRFAEATRREIGLLGYVPSVDLFGVRNAEISIEVSEEALRRYGVSLSEVANAVGGTSVNISAGNVRSDGGNVQLRTRSQADTQAEFENIIVKQMPNGAVVRVSDMAKVIDGFEEVNLLATVNGKRTILVQVMNGPNMNIVKMAKNVRGYYDEAVKHTPPGITMTIWQDSSIDYMSRIRLIGSNFLMGLGLVLITLLLFLRPKIAIWVAVGIGTAFAGGLALLPLMDVSFNMISTFAFLLVIGVIVDDAIIVGEAIHSRTEDGEEGLTAAINGTTMVIKPVIFAVFTTMIFFAPWMMLSGGTSEFTRSISLVVILALTFSLIESLLILPAHLSHLKPASRDSRFARFQDTIANSIVWVARNLYRPLMVAALRQRYLTAAIFVGGMVLSVGLLTNGLVKTIFFPETESDQIAVTVELPEGTPYSRTLEVLAQIQAGEKALEDEINASTNGEGKLIENWYTRSRDNNVLALVKLVPPETRTLTAKETAERLRALIGEVPDAETITVNYKNADTDPPIQYMLNSTDLDALNAAAEDLMLKLRSYDGVYNVVNDVQSATDEIQFDLKPGAESLGITTADVARQVRQGFYGEEVQRLPRDGEDVRVFVRYPRSDRESLDFLNNIRIRTADGRELPLYAVADIRFEKGISQINRRERRRAIVVSAEVAAERITEIRNELDNNFFESFDKAHPQVRRGNIGRAQGEAEFFAEIMTLLLIAIGVAYFLVAVAFKSYAEPILILLAAIPFCFTGAMVGHLVMGFPLSILSYMGIMAAAGVAVNDNLVLIDYVHQLRDRGMDGAQALVEAGTRRFRPILLTSLTTFVGLLPLMLERSIQAQFLIPIGVGLAFGVLFALFVTLFFVPALYGIGADIKRFFAHLITGKHYPAFDAQLDMKALEEIAPVPAE